MTYNYSNTEDVEFDTFFEGNSSDVTEVDDGPLDISAIVVTETVGGLILNIITIIVILRGRHTGKDSKVQLVNISLSDITFCLVTSFYYLAVATPEIPKSLGFCRFSILIATTGTYAAVLWRMVVSIERLLIAFAPTYQNTFARIPKLAAAAITWLCCFLVPINVAIHANVFSWKSKQTVLFHCHTSREAHFWSSSTISTMPPAIMILAYGVVVGKFCFTTRYGRSGISQSRNYFNYRQVSLFK